MSDLDWSDKENESPEPEDNGDESEYELEREQPTKRKRAPSANKRASMEAGAPSKKGKNNKSAKPRGKASGLQNQLRSMPPGQLVQAIATFFSTQPPQLTVDFLASLPAADTSAFVDQLEKSAGAIRKALPKSRYGSSTDHFGFKRCSSAVTAFKSVWNEQVAALSGDPSALLDWSNKAVDVLNQSVSFDAYKDNGYKTLCAKKLTGALSKMCKSNAVSPDLKTSAEEITATVGRYI